MLKPRFGLPPAILMLAAAASAATIHLDSVPGLNVFVYSSGVTLSTVETAAHPAWMPPNPVNPGDPGDTSAVWISYADTGYQGTNFQPFMGSSPVMRVWQTFNSGAGALTVKVWADDTASIILDNVLIKAASLTQSVCSGQPIGCRPNDFALVSTPLSAGMHTLAFDVYQIGTDTTTTLNPFGLLFSGVAPADPAPNPEPATLALIGGGLLALAGWRRWSRR